MHLDLHPPPPGPDRGPRHWRTTHRGRPAHGLLLAPYGSGTTTWLTHIAHAARAARMRLWHADPTFLDPALDRACDWASEHPAQVLRAALALPRHPVPTLVLLDHAHHATETDLADWERLALHGPGRGVGLVAATPTLARAGVGSALLRDALTAVQYAVLGELDEHGSADAARDLPACPAHPGGGVYVNTAAAGAAARAA
ncbi:hypothetical protein ABZ234_31830 [Nocardiopsis sp. NPDC006198]|uniref:hypothetical protein n=1 Tax=Nocardiopsis sp. NPDC006198 TaxID=3154472 RepID=UPI0033BC54F1